MKRRVACLLLCLSSLLGVVGGGNSFLGSADEREATVVETTTITRSQTTTATTTPSDDLDNSIRHADVAPTNRQADSQQDKRRRLDEKNKETTRSEDNKAAAEQPVESNDLAPSGNGQFQWQPRQIEKKENHHFHHQLERQEATTRLLSRRLDLLEFELRKTILLLHHQMRIKSLPEENQAEDKQTSQSNGAEHSSKDEQAPPIGKSQLQLEALADLGSRLELMEKFITVTTKKLFETEQRVKQLERCDCRLKCKWTKPADVFVANSQQQQQQTPLVKMDGQVWRHHCDVCSCHRGHVRCRHVSCPKADCPEPSYVPGRCCPVCHKNCVFNGQTVKHSQKLVINSKQNTCKECLCSDGRLKCHRVEQLELVVASGNNVSLPGWHETATTTGTSTLSAAQTGDYWQANRTRRIQRSTPIDLGLDFGVDTSSGSSSTLTSSATPNGGGDKIDELLSTRQDGRWTTTNKKGTSFYGPLLVCPQIDCKLEDQTRLKNDCCTYCRGFDFCSLHGRAHCHPNSACVLAARTNNNSSLVAASQEEVDSGILPTLGSMFECRCRSGFSGNGRFCRDIDECADKKLNDCDPRTSYCVNLPGSYQCKCRPGYRNNLDSSSDSNSNLDLSRQNSSDTHMRQQSTQIPDGNGKTETRRPLKSCRDINECIDGKLNRCHQQARCVNLSGSYKCHCKRGYLGNGFECHQWFSSQPDVAAYLHRHSSPDSQSHQTNKTSLGSRGAIKVALSSLLDPDEDRSDLAREELDSLEYKYDDDADDADDIDAVDSINNHQDGGQNSSPEAAADLADSRWEPLRFVEQANVFQQTGGLVSASQQVAHDDNLGPSANPLNGPETSTSTSTEPPVPSESSLNTRTMFFQPPPRNRRPPIASGANSITPATPPDSKGTQMTSSSSASSTTSMTTRSDKHNASDMTTKSQPLAASHNLYESAKQTIASESSNNSTTQRADSLASQQQQPQLRRGSIIASATTSPSRGFGHNPNQHHHATQLQHRNLFHQQHKALRVSSSSTTINNLAKVHSLATRSGSYFGPIFGPLSSLNLVLTLIATILQILSARGEPLFQVLH